jgi:hypothetical protein
MLSLSTYIIHYTPLAERKRAIESNDVLRALGHTYITEKDVARLYNDFSNAIYRASRASNSIDLKLRIFFQVKQISHILWHHKEAIMHQIQAISRPESRLQHELSAIDIKQFYFQALAAYTEKNTELSMQHIAALELFLDSSNNLCLILEDDSVPSVFCEDIEMLSGSLSSYWPIMTEPSFIDLSSSLGFYPSRNTLLTDASHPCKLGKMEYGQTRCSSAYLVNRSAAALILKKTLERGLFLPIDWHLSYILSAQRIPTWWALIPMFDQGSQTHAYISNATNRSR